MGNSLSGVHILVVDDYVDFAAALREELESHGATVATALDGADALSTLSTCRFHFVLTDTQMPRMDGLALLRWTKIRHPEVPVVVFFTPGGQPQYPKLQSDDVIRMGAAGVMSKPVDMPQLLQLLSGISASAN